jgi:hypothetical protein
MSAKCQKRTSEDPLRMAGDAQFTNDGALAFRMRQSGHLVRKLASRRCIVWRRA